MATSVPLLPPSPAPVASLPLASSPPSAPDCAEPDVEARRRDFGPAACCHSTPCGRRWSTAAARRSMLCSVESFWMNGLLGSVRPCTSVRSSSMGGMHTTFTR